MAASLGTNTVVVTRVFCLRNVLLKSVSQNTEIDTNGSYNLFCITTQIGMEESRNIERNMF